MRVVGEIPNPNCKITIFSWNNKYLLKFEQGMLEQTYKVNEYDVSSEADLHEIVNTEFIVKVLQLFDTMEQNIQTEIAKL